MCFTWVEEGKSIICTLDKMHMIRCNYIVSDYLQLTELQIDQGQ
jgi:hypothetical protein